MIRQKRKIAIKYVLRTLQNFRKETNKKKEEEEEKFILLLLNKS
jgi:hypothetical protein